MSVPSHSLHYMQSTSDLFPSTSVSMRLDRAQKRIRALTAGRGTLTLADRLELAEWQREWVAAWQESEYMAAA